MTASSSFRRSRLPLVRTSSICKSKKCSLFPSASSGMRNLVLLSERRRALIGPSEVDADDGSPIVSMTIDPSAPRDDGRDDDFHHHPRDAMGDDDVPPSSFYLTSRGSLIATASGGICWECDLNAVVSEPDDDDTFPCWFDLTYVDDLDALVCLSRRGAIVTVEKGSGTAELVGEFDNGIAAGCWSPDKEILALYTHTDAEEEESGDGDGTNEGEGGDAATVLPALMTMNAQFEVLSETIPEISALPISLVATDEASVSICWRPDGTAVAVATVDSSDNVRRIRTYNRDDLALVSIGRSEDGSGKTVPNLLATAGIAWSGIGCSQLITSAQRKGKRADTPRLVVFFEPNGLRHKEFKLRPEPGWEETVVDLCWNCNSDLLSVTLHCIKAEGNGGSEEDTAPTIRSKVQLWHRSNYHWYCKYELRYDGARVSMVNFDEERPHDMQVAIVCKSVEVRSYVFAWDASTVSPDGTAASIDGSQLSFTPFKQAMVPPPMYFATVTMDAPVLGVTSTPFCAGKMGGISWIACLSDGSICLLGERNQLEAMLEENSNIGRPQRFVAPTVLAKVALPNAQTMRQFLVIRANLNEGGEAVVRCIAIACALVDESSNSSQISEHVVEVDVTLNGSTLSANVVGSIPADGRILRIANWSDTTEQIGALVELSDGSLLEYVPSPDSASPGTLVPSDAEPMLEPCPWIAGLHSTTASGISSESIEKRVVVGMSRRSRLYFGERILSDACSSFILTPTHRFLSYATLGSRSQLRFIPLSALAEYDPLMGSEENLLALGEGYEPRNLERGSRVVAILPEAPTTVLQLPRGNLEGIYPRALVLPFSMHLIEHEKYGQAMEIMRRQKIDLNLFCDMDPVHFLEGDGVAKFVTAVGTIDYLNLFISCLFDGDITKWKYRVPSWFGESTAVDVKERTLHKKDFDFTTKVNQVCGKMREVMMQFESDGKTLSGKEVSDDHFLLPVLSTFAKQNPPKLEEALSMIRENAMAKSSARSKKSPLLGDKAQGSIQYLAFLADYPLLFDTALGMYDFDLARAVARNSQMDPKVYLPLLKRLRSLPESTAKYEVDIRLERFESALTHLVSSSTDESVEDEHFARCLSFIKKHKLHRLGLELYESDNIRKNEIMESLAERLLTEGQGQAALSIFCIVGPTNLEGAMRAAQVCGEWKSFFSLLDESIANDIEETKQTQRSYYAEDIATEIAAGKDSSLDQREAYACAARILLDYGQDVIGAIDMLIKAHMWSEGRRIARLNERNDLVKKCIDAASSYGQNCIEDFEMRSIEFAETNVRYEKCLVLRKDAKRREAVEGVEDAVPDDSGSMFSLASNMSNTSVQSNMSGSSVSTVGSVTSVSSVITAQQTTSFSIVSDEDVNKHKSKFNRIGGGKKKKKKKPPKRSRRRIMPGSAKELEDLVGQLKFNCVDDAYLLIIADTISFLLQVGKQSLARAIFDAYNKLGDNITKSQQERKASTQKEIEESRTETLREGRDYESVTIECEAEIDALSCKEMPISIQQVFSFI